MMQDFKVYYDADEDVLFFAKEGTEAETVEIAPGVNIEVDDTGAMIGVEVLHASSVFKDVIQPMQRKLHVA